MQTDRQTDRQVAVDVHGLRSELFAFAPVFVTRLRFPSLRSACLHPASFNHSNTFFFFVSNPPSCRCHGATCLSALEASHVQTHQADVECSCFSRYFYSILQLSVDVPTVCVACTI